MYQHINLQRLVKTSSHVEVDLDMHMLVLILGAVVSYGVNEGVG